MSAHYSHKKQSDFICVDKDADSISGTQANKNGAFTSTLWKDSVAAYRVVHMSLVESWLELCAPSERKNVFSTVDFKGQNVIFKMNCIDLKT